MSQSKDHTVLTTICVLIGVIVTITLAVATNVYNNSQNVSRDKYYADNCKTVTREKTMESTKVYDCKGE